MRRTIGPTLAAVLTAWIALASPANAQLAPQPKLPDSRFADLGGLTLEYFEFGTRAGPPIVFLQDFHDYFRLEEAPGWREYLARFGDRYRVLAPVRRGFGASDDPHWGFDVPTQGEDLLRFLDALGIGKAALVGRVPATQEMAWLAEHHPERLAGLVFVERPLLFTDLRDPELREWAQAFWRGACDLGDRAVDIAGPRGPWQPHFLTDSTRRIEVPAAVLTFPPFAGSMDLRILDMLSESGDLGPSCAAGVQEYYDALAKDTVRIRRLREKLVASDRNAELAERMARAFGSHLRIVEYRMSPGGEPGGIPEPWYQHTRAFLDELADRGGWR